MQRSGGHKLPTLTDAIFDCHLLNLYFSRSSQVRIVDEDSRRQPMGRFVIELGIGGNLRRRVDLLRGRFRIGCTLSSLLISLFKTLDFE